MSEIQGFKRDSYLIICDPMKMTSGKFGARYVIHKGDTATGPIVHQQQFPAPSEEFDNAEDAKQYAADRAMEWVDKQV